jgi:hypothetical protein
MMTGFDVPAQPEAPVAPVPVPGPPERFAIGQPGRAAFATPDGPPPAEISPPDLAASSAALPGMLLRAASVRGIQHKAQHTARQDAFALAQADGSHAIAVVCDGVGSLDRSDYAAAFVSQRLARLAMSGVPWRPAFEAANAELGKVAAEWESLRLGGMATTAVALTVTRRAGWWFGEVAWVGDSPLWHLGDDGAWQPVTEAPAEGDRQGFHSSTVRPMPTQDGWCSWCSFRVYGGALFAMSDGVGNPLAWSAEVRDTLASWWASPPDLLTFTAQVGFARKSHIDDRTVVGIWPDGE